MDYKKYLLAVFAAISLTDAVKVNMQGTLSFGKEVMDTLTHYMRKNNFAQSSRRAMAFSSDTDVFNLIIKSTYLCRDLAFCEGKLEKLLNEYIMVLTKSIEAIFEGMFDQKEITYEENNYVKQLFFEEQLKKCLAEIRKLLRNINVTSEEGDVIYKWSEIIKKISAMFQTAAIIFATQRIEGNPTDIGEEKKKLTEKIVIATVIVEGKYEHKLCSEHGICAKSFKVTKALETLLGSFKDMKEENVKIFIRYVSEALMDSNFYSILSDVTTNALQIILNDMAYSDNVPTKEVLLSIHRTVDARLKALVLQKYIINSRDVELVHVILSDMDHVYSKSNTDPFYSFLTSFYDWTRTGSRLSSQVRTLLKAIAVQLRELPDDLSVKLIQEVRSFLQITVDPEK